MHLKGHFNAWLCELNIKMGNKMFLPLSEYTVISCNLQLTQYCFSKD